MRRGTASALGVALLIGVSASPAWALPPGAPGQPTTVAGNAQIVVTFTAPSDNGGNTILSYTATCNPTGAGATNSVTDSSGLVNPITVTGLTNGDPYTCTVHATNADGTGAESTASTPAVTPATVPSAPPQPETVPSNARIAVTFAAPGNGGSPITGYTATCTPTGAGAPGNASIVGATANPITVTGVTNGDPYTCTVHASNAIGTGAESPSSTPAVTPAPTRPDSPPQPTTVPGNTQITVTYTAPATDGGSPITGYTATCTPTGAGTPGSASSVGVAPTPIVVTGLTNGDPYTCTVHATNAVGAGFESIASTPAVTPGATQPGAPAQPTAAPGNTQITVNFATPSNNGGSPITGYTATCTSTGGGTPGSASIASATASPIVVTGLTNGDPYTCTVHATNAVGNSAESPASAPAVTPATVPTAPAQPTTVPGNAQIVVSFVTPASNGGSPITGYTATCTPTGVGVGGTASIVGANAAPITVMGLTNGDTYTCTVHATNVVGSSLESVASSPAVAPNVTAPAAPAQPMVAPANFEIIVSYLAPASGGSTITGYTATCTPTGAGTPGSAGILGSSATPITVTGLTDGDPYTCTVTATNAIGTSLPSPASASVVPNPVPDPPLQPTVAGGKGLIKVTYAAPADNGFPIVSYTATCTSSGTGTPGAHTIAATTPPTPITVSPLTNGQTYTCTVIATNANGSGPPSPPSAAIIPATVPATPKIIAATSGDGALKVSFAPQGNNGSTITSFTVQCTSSNGGAPASASGPGSPVTVNGLSNGNIYRCTVTATNAIGTSVASAASKAIIVGGPGAPVIVNVIPGIALTSRGGFHVSFRGSPNNGSSIASYRVTCAPVTGGPAFVGTGTGSPIAVTGMNTGHQYSCSMVGTNARGTSATSNVVRATVGTPGAPHVLEVLPLAQGLAVPFVAPPGNGKPVINYHARCTSPNGGQPVNPQGNASPIVASNLTPGATYTCLVTANNARGTGAPATVGPVVIGALPGTTLASCNGSSGTLHATPGLFLTQAASRSLVLKSTLNCSGHYVHKTTISLSFRSKSPYSCTNAIGAPNAGSGALTWISPDGLGQSGASIQFVFGSSNGHSTTARFSGVVTSRNNLFSNAVVSGTVRMQQGLNDVAIGGDCSTDNRLQLFNISSITMTLS